MVTKRQSKVSLDVEMTKNLCFSVSFCPKELIKDDQVYINPCINSGKYVGIWYNNIRVNTAVTSSKWRIEYITGESEEEVYNKFHKKFEKKYSCLKEKPDAEEKIILEQNRLVY